MDLGINSASQLGLNGLWAEEGFHILNSCEKKKKSEEYFASHKNYFKKSKFIIHKQTYLETATSISLHSAYGCPVL